MVVLAGRATRVPLAAVTSGIQRTTTVTSRELSYWAHSSDHGWKRRPKLHGMQGVKFAVGGMVLDVTRPLCPSAQRCPSRPIILRRFDVQEVWVT
jgi:hypothetical protein